MRTGSRSCAYFYESSFLREKFRKKSRTYRVYCMFGIFALIKDKIFIDAIRAVFLLILFFRKSGSVRTEVVKRRPK